MTSRTIAGQATQNLVWDESSRLETLTQGTTTTGFLYDADGSRVARRDSGVTTVMIDNTFEWSSAGGLVSYYSHGGQVIAMRNTAGLQWMFGDHLGSASTVRTPAGTNVRQRYLPFGRVRGAAGLPTEYGFTGQRLDPSGLMDYNARQYDPVLGRFTSPDTIIPDSADPQSFNRYTYVTNNPVNFIDPTGHKGCSPGRKCPGGPTSGAPSGPGGGPTGEDQYDRVAERVEDGTLPPTYQGAHFDTPIAASGRVRIDVFISGHRALLLGYGDGRVSDANFNPLHGRAAIIVDMDTGKTYVVLNGSCVQGGTCFDAQPIGNGWGDNQFEVAVTDLGIGNQTVTITYRLKNGFVPSPAIDHQWILQVSGGTVTGGSFVGDGYPTVDAYLDSGGATSTLFHHDEGGLGGILDLPGNPVDHRFGGD